MMGMAQDLGSKDWGLGSSSLVKPKLPHLSNGDGDGNSKNSNIYLLRSFLGFPPWLGGKESACQGRRQGFDP